MILTAVALVAGLLVAAVVVPETRVSQTWSRRYTR
jgi:hypothetical protein